MVEVAAYSVSFDLYMETFLLWLQVVVFGRHEDNFSVYVMALKYCFEKRYIVISYRYLIYLSCITSFSMKRKYLFSLQKKLWVFFGVPIVVSCYQIGRGYISGILNNPKVKVYFTGSVGNRTERLMVLICSGPDC